MRALVTGATGFIGSNLVKRLLADGHRVTALGAFGEQVLADHPRLTLQTTPFYEFEWNRSDDIDTVFHQAAITDTRVKDRDKMMQINTDHAYEFINDALDHISGKVVYASSCAVYGGSEAPFVEGRGEKPLNVYGESKLRLDEAVREMIEDGCSRIVGLRYSNVFGPGESHKGAMTSMVYKFGRQISSKERPSLFSWGGQKRDFIYVDDVVEANLCAARAEGSHIVNCGSGVATRFNTVVGEVQRVYSRPGPFAYMPENPYKATFQDHTECDTSLAERTIGFRAKISVREGIAKYHESGALTAA